MRMFHNKKFYLTLLFGSILAMFFVSPVSANNNEFQNGSIVTLGDSITQGWNGNQVVSEPYPIILGKLLNTAVDNQFSIGGAKIDGKENKDLPDTINTFIKSSSFEKTKVVVLAYGINDLNYSTQSLRNIIISLKQSISNLHQANPDIKIYAILPHQSFILPTQNTVGSARFSENDLLDKMAQVYQSFGIPVMDWRSNPIITPENHLKTLGDSVHPTQKTYQVIAEQLATWMLENQPSTVIEEESHLDIDTLFKKGFQVDPHLNSTVYIDQNGAKKTGMWQLSNGTYYYSAIDTGSWITNNWVHANGETYYASDSGEIIQGVFPVNGVWYDFGKNSTYYVRGPLNGYIYSPSCSTTNGGWNWFENGIPYTGFRYYMGTYYWFVNGVRQNEGWRQAWNYIYYTDKDGRAVSGKQLINGHSYDFGTNGTYYLKSSGYLYLNEISVANGGYLWLENGQKYTGFRYYMGTYYWFMNGIRQNEGWHQSWGYQYYTDKDGRAVQGNIQINGQAYYFGNNGTYYLRQKN